MSNNSAKFRSQDLRFSNETAAPNPRRAISGHRERDEYLKTLCEVGGEMTPLQFRTAIRLGLFFNCTSGQCNPGYPKLARAVRAEIGSVKKVCRELEADGWIKRHRSAGGNHKNTTSFDLFIPTARGSAADTREDRERGSKFAATGVQNDGGRVSAADSLMNTDRTLKKNTEGAPPARRTCYVDTERPKSKPEPISIERARVLADALEDILPFDWKADPASIRELTLTLGASLTEKDLNAKAENYATHVSQTKEPIVPLAQWLHQQRTGISISSS